MSGKPTLFADGELPVVTASGLDPKVLLKVPWQARRTVARTATTVGVYALLERYGGADGATQAEVDAMPGGPLANDVTEYLQTVSRWKSGSA